MPSGPSTDAGETLLVNQYGERYLHAVNRDSFSRTGADSVFSRHFGSDLSRENHLYIVIGTDSGLLPAHVLSRDIPRGSRFLFIELADVLDTLTARQMLPGTAANLRYSTPEDWEETAQALGLNDYLYIDGASVNLSLAASDAFVPEYRLLTQQVQEAFDARLWQVQQGMGTYFFYDTMLANLAENRHPVTCLTRGGFRGMTAVLLAGGPSLDPLLPWVKANRDSLVVIAVSRICRHLHESDLVPDIVVSIDPTQLSFDISKEMLELPDDVLLVNANHVNPPLLGQWHGRSLYLGRRFPWPTALNPENIATGGPTVTNSALMLATDMGFGQVVLGGVDLCLSPEGFSHARGSNEHAAGPLLGHIGLAVETNDGRQAETRHDFAHAIASISAQAQVSARLGCTFINPSPQAARIEAVEHRPVEEIRLTALPAQARELIRSCLPADDRETRIRDYHSVETELERSRNEFDRIARLAVEAVDNNRLLFSEAANPKHRKRLRRIEKTLEGELADKLTYLKTYGLKRLVRLTRPDEALELSNEEAETTAHEYYSILGSCAREMIATIDRTASRIAARLDEERDTPDPDTLVACWEADHQPGRARLWLERQPQAAAALTPAQRQRFDALLAAYRQTLEERDTGHARKISREAELDGVRSKALLLFQHQDREGLAALLAGLDSHPHADAASYRHLVGGYLAELDGDTPAAMAAYQGITAGPMLEDALKRIAYLSLGEYDMGNAALALECLSHISPGYLAQYADVLRLDGNLQQAAEAYMNYLNNAPDDLSTAIKLGRLHQEAGNTDVAGQIYDYVLDRDPANKAARQLRNDLEATA